MSLSYYYLYVSALGYYGLLELVILKGVVCYRLMVKIAAA